ncbi:Flagellar biosynthesis protein, FliO [compost metagenome]
MWIGACKLLLVCGAVMAAGLLTTRLSYAQDARGDNGAATFASGVSLPSSIPVKREQSSDASGRSDDRWWVAVVAVGGLLAVATAIARRKVLGGKGKTSWPRLGGLLDTVSSHEIERVSSTRLSPSHSLHVVVWEGRRLLLGCSDQSIQLLSESSPAVQDAHRAQGQAVAANASSDKAQR